MLLFLIADIDITARPKPLGLQKNDIFKLTVLAH
jgi:hypothetical protein